MCSLLLAAGLHILRLFDSIESVLLFFFVGVCSNMGKKACTRVMSDCKLATTVESLSTDGRKRHERKVFLYTLRRNMHHLWSIQDVLLADPSKKGLESQRGIHHCKQSEEIKRPRAKAFAAKSFAHGRRSKKPQHPLPEAV